MKRARVRPNAKAVPGRHAVHPDLAVADVALKTLEGCAQSLLKRFARNRRQLRFGVVYVIDINRSNPHVVKRLVNLALQIAWSHAMSADDLREVGDARTHEGLFDVTAFVQRRFVIERQVTAFRADDDLVAS